MLWRDRHEERAMVAARRAGAPRGWKWSPSVMAWVEAFERGDRVEGVVRGFQEGVRMGRKRAEASLARPDVDVFVLAGRVEVEPAVGFSPDGRSVMAASERVGRLVRSAGVCRVDERRGVSWTG